MLNVAVLRAEDLESRELLAFDRLQEAGLLSATAIGDRPTTPYGTESISIDVQIRPSISSRLRRLPMGRTIAGGLSDRLPSGFNYSPGLRRALSGFDVINARETFQAQTMRAAEVLQPRRPQRLVVSCFENIPFRYEDNEVLARHKDRVRARADLFVANSPGASAALESEGAPPERIQVIPPSVDTEQFSPGPRSHELRAGWHAAEDDIVILYAGRLQQEKGLSELLLALRTVLACEEGRIRLVMHGAGPERPRLRRIVQKFGLRDRVAFSDWLPLHEMPDVYRSGDIVVLPSLETPYWREQFGFNLVEAMSCGRAVVASATGEIPWVVGRGGVLVDTRSPSSVSSALEQLASNPARRAALEKAARTEAVSRFAINEAGHRLVESFELAMTLPARVSV
jgi:glycosyltransferase involved in cell wall biosynthesis